MRPYALPSSSLHQTMVWVGAQAGEGHSALGCLDINLS